MSFQFPKLHLATWPGVVGKKPGSAEPPIELSTMLDLAAAAEVDGERFDGVDIYLGAPHTSIDASDDDLLQLADAVTSRGLKIGSAVAPVWTEAGGGCAFGNPQERKAFLAQVEKAAGIARTLRELGVRDTGIIRIDSAGSPERWSKDPDAFRHLVATFKTVANIVEANGEKAAMEGEICWGGLHGYKDTLQVLQAVDRSSVGFQADLAHTLLYLLGYNAPDQRLLPERWDWDRPNVFDIAYRKLTDALRPHTFDFHVAQNDATVKGSGDHDKTGRHCMPDDPNGKLDIVKQSGSWLRNGGGKLTKVCRHICWDGCMFPNSTITDPTSANKILATMIAVRNAHGWNE